MKRILILLAIFAMTVKASFAQNPVIAHRGAWKAKALPENSIASLKEAIRLGCYGTEFDVHMTNDGVLVVNHDAEFLGLPIEKSSYQQLLAKKLSNGETIPRLEEYLQEGLKQHQTKLILEIKPSQAGLEMDLLLTAKTVKMVQEMRGEDAIDYISFSYDILKKVLELQPKASVAYLKGDIALEQLKKDGFYGADYHYSVYKRGDWFPEAKRLGLTINAWTVNDRENMQWLLDQRADFITTNEPEMLFELIRR